MLILGLDVATVTDQVTWIVRVSWMPSALRTHATKSHWPRIKATKAYRKLVGQEAQAQGLRRIPATGIDAVVTFFPPRRRELDVLRQAADDYRAAAERGAS